MHHTGVDRTVTVFPDRQIQAYTASENETGVLYAYVR